MAHSKDRTSIMRAGPGGSGAVSVVSGGKAVRVEWAKLAPPANVYDADFAWVVERHGTVSLFFAKEHLSGKRLRTRMEIRFAPESFAVTLWDNSVKFYEGLKGLVATLPPAPPTRSAEELMALESDREHSDWADFAYMAHHYAQASLDFFRIPPPAVARFVKGGSTLELEPNAIVRVQTTTWELSRLLEMCEPIASRVRASLPSEVTSDE